MRALPVLLLLTACKADPASTNESDADVDADADSDADADTDGDTDSDDPSVPPTPYVASGSRLSAVFFVDPTGYRRFAGFWDRTLEIACRFERTTPTTEHCVPLSDHGLRTFFDTASCASPLLSAPAGCPLDPYESVVIADDACAVLRAPWEIAGSLGPHSVFYEQDLGTCSQVTPVPDGDGWVGVRADLSLFVEATRTVASAAGVDVTVREGADGSREVAGFLLPSSETCRAFTMAGDGSTRCLPFPDVAYYNEPFVAYADPACTAPIATTSLECTTPSVVLAVAGPSDSIAVYEVGGPLPAGSPSYSTLDGPCAPESSSFATFPWSVGAPIPDADFPELGPLVDLGSPNTQPWRTDLAGTPLIPLDLGSMRFDAPGGPCVLRTLGTGLICVPESSATVSAFTAFADSGCTQPLAEAPNGTVVLDDVPSDGCARNPWDTEVVGGVFDVGAVHTGAVFEQPSPGGVCGPMAGATPTLHTLTAAVLPIYTLEGL